MSMYLITRRLLIGILHCFPRIDFQNMTNEIQITNRRFDVKKLYDTHLHVNY